MAPARVVTTQVGHHLRRVESHRVKVFVVCRADEPPSGEPRGAISPQGRLGGHEPRDEDGELEERAE